MEKVYSKNKCSGCGICAQKCPKNAIDMVADQNGFIYPKIDQNKCIDCHLCQKVCGFNHHHLEKGSTYCGTINNREEKLQSSSGGLAYFISKEFLKNKGFVYGVTASFDGEECEIKHCEIQSLEELKLTQGSKYVKSKISKNLLINIEDKLKIGKQVLFIGTPCQVASVLNLFSKYRENLYTIDIVCHGTPSQALFNGYLKSYEHKHKCKIIDVRFRDKKYGWGHNGAIISKKNDEIKKDKITPQYSSYYDLFYKGDIYQKSCYDCPFAACERVGDLSLGDCWGIDKEYPEYIKKDFIYQEGIGLLFINNSKGQKLIDIIKNHIKIREVEVTKLLKYNPQLYEPVKLNEKSWNNVFNSFSQYGYSRIEKQFTKKFVYRKLRHLIGKLIPKKLKYRN